MKHRFAMVAVLGFLAGCASPTDAPETKGLGAQKEALNITFLGGDGPNGVWNNALGLPRDMGDGVSVRWESDTPSVITITDTQATVNRPTQGDKSVVLTARLSRGAETTSKTFSVVVRQKGVNPSLASLVGTWNRTRQVTGTTSVVTTQTRLTIQADSSYLSETLQTETPTTGSPTVTYADYRGNLSLSNWLVYLNPTESRSGSTPFTGDTGWAPLGSYSSMFAEYWNAQVWGDKLYTDLYWSSAFPGKLTTSWQRTSALGGSITVELKADGTTKTTAGDGSIVLGTWTQGNDGTLTITPGSQGTDPSTYHCQILTGAAVGVGQGYSYLSLEELPQSQSAWTRE